MARSKKRILLVVLLILIIASIFISIDAIDICSVQVGHPLPKVVEELGKPDTSYMYSDPRHGQVLVYDYMEFLDFEPNLIVFSLSDSTVIYISTVRDCR